MLVAGVVLGLALGPTMLGQLSPQLYDTMFVNRGDTSDLQKAQTDLEDFKTNADRREQKIKDIIAQYELVGTSDDSITTARDEQLVALTNGFADEEVALRFTIEQEKQIINKRETAYRNKLSGIATGIVLLIVLLLAVEAIANPQYNEIKEGQAELSPLPARLITIRYGLASGWLTLMLAQPHWLRGIDLWFGGLLLLVVLVVGLIPLGKNATTSPSTAKKPI